MQKGNSVYEYRKFLGGAVCKAVDFRLLAAIMSICSSFQECFSL